MANTAGGITDKQVSSFQNDGAQMEKIRKLAALGQINPDVANRVLASTGLSPEAARAMGIPTPQTTQTPEQSISAYQAPTPKTNGISDMTKIPGPLVASHDVTPSVGSGVTDDVVSPDQLAVAPKQQALQMPKQAPVKDYTGEVNRGYNMQQTGVLGQAEAESDKSDAIAQSMTDTQNALDKFEAGRIEKEQNRQNIYADEHNKFESELQNFKEQKIDPNRYWANIGTEKKVLWALSAFLSGASGKGGNVGLDMLKGAVESDINAQKTELEKLKQGLGYKENVLTNMYKRFGDERQAEIAARSAIIDRMQMQNQVLTAKYNSPLVKAKSLEAIGKLDAEKATVKANMDRFAAETAEKRAKSGNSALTAQIKSRFGTNPMLEALPEADRKRYVKGPGFEGLAISEERAKKLNEMAQDATQSIDGIRRLIAIGNKYGRQTLPSEAAAEADSIRLMLQGSLRTALLGPGTVNDTERELLKSVIADPTAMLQLNATKRLKVLEDTVMKKVKSAANGEGIKIKELSPTRN